MSKEAARLARKCPKLLNEYFPQVLEMIRQYDLRKVREAAEVQAANV